MESFLLLSVSWSLSPPSTQQEKPKPVTQRNKKPDEEDEEFTANEEEGKQAIWGHGLTERNENRDEVRIVIQ